MLIKENLFSRIIDTIEKTILVDQSEDVPQVLCSFKRWAGRKGLLGCLDKETADYISQIVSKFKINGKTFRAWPRGEYGKLRRLTFYVPSQDNLPAGQAEFSTSRNDSMDCLVHQNELPGRYVIYSFQEVRNTDRAGVEHHGHHYHVGVNEEMKEVILKKDCQLFICLQTISVSLPGKIP